MQLMKRLMKEEAGQGLVEYTLIIEFIAVLLVTALTSVKDSLVKSFSNIANKF